MKVVLAGGTGQIGRFLARTFARDGHEVVVLSRKVTDSRGKWRTVLWDGMTQGEWAAELEDADVLINLAGRSVNCRYTPRNRRLITESRVDSTHALAKAISQADHPPKVWLQSSTATIYAHRYDAPNDETNGIIGGAEPNVPETWRFSIEVATAWEEAINTAALPRTRQVLLRSAMVMTPQKGGAFNAMLALVRYGLGGRMGDGRQYVSWIHEADFVRAIYWLIENDLVGPVNLAAPYPLPNAEFMRILRQAWGTRVGLPAPKWMLEIGAFFLRTETELILKSRRVVPSRLLERGFEFRFPHWPHAASDLCRRFRHRCSRKDAPESQPVFAQHGEARTVPSAPANQAAFLPNEISVVKSSTSRTGGRQPPYLKDKATRAR